MLYSYNEGTNIVVERDDETPVTIGDMLEAIAYGCTDFVELANEGYPVNYGNSYAAYEFLTLQNGALFTYSMGPDSVDLLNSDGMVTLEPFGWNDLETVDEGASWIRGN